jgi:hypothetical protein
MKPDHKAGLQFMNLDLGQNYFFTHLLVASSHFMSFVFSQSAFVVGTAGASAANAGAVNASKRVATIALLRNLTDIEVSSFKLGHLMTPGLTMHL